MPAQAVLPWEEGLRKGLHAKTIRKMLSSSFQLALREVITYMTVRLLAGARFHVHDPWTSKSHDPWTAILRFAMTQYVQQSAHQFRDLSSGELLVAQQLTLMTRGCQACSGMIEINPAAGRGAAGRSDEAGQQRRRVHE